MPVPNSSIFEPHAKEIDKLKGKGITITEIARRLNSKHSLHASDEQLRRNLSMWLQRREVREDHPALAEECEATGIPVEDVRHYWHKGRSFSIFVKGKEAGYDELRADIVAEIRSHAPKYQKITHKPIKEGHLLVISPADIHLNKLCRAFETGEDCDHNVIYERVISGVSGLIQKAQGFPIDKILFVGGNDILHVDNPNNTTTGGTRQDVSMMWYDAFTMAKRLMVECLEMLVPIAPVTFVFNPSNHDFSSGFFLAQTIQAHFDKCKEIDFNINMQHRKYERYGLNLIGLSHGDGAKEKDLPLLMAHEAAQWWGECKHRYYYFHHIHHKSAKDHMSVCVESLRSPSGTDAWHAKSGYMHAPKAVEGFIHHKEHGQICRITHLF